MQIETTMRDPDTLIGMSKIKVVTPPNADKNAKKIDHSYTAGGNAKWYSHSDKQLGSFL